MCGIICPVNVGDDCILKFSDRQRHPKENYALSMSRADVSLDDRVNRAVKNTFERMIRGDDLIKLAEHYLEKYPDQFSDDAFMKMLKTNYKLDEDALKRAEARIKEAVN